LLINATDQPRFDPITGGAQLRVLHAGQGHDWPDTDILIHNGYAVVGSASYIGQFKKLSKQRIDYFSVLEIWQEADQHAEQGWVVEASMVLQDPAAIYFFVNQKDQALARRLEEGLRRAIADGSFEALFFECFGEVIQRARLAARTRFDLEHPLLSSETPLDQPQRWRPYQKMTQRSKPPVSGRTIARDLTLGLALTIALVVVSVGGINYATSVKQVDQELERRATDIIGKLADILASPLWNIEESEIQKIGQVYMDIDNVVVLRIVDEDGSVVFEQRTVEEADDIARRRAITYDGHPVGEVEVSLTRRSIHVIKQRILLTTFVLMFLVILAVVVAMRVLLHHYLDLPLIKLTEGIGHVASGSYHHRLARVKQGDVNEIIQAVNLMAEAIQSREEKLHRAKEDLEQRVHERTAELEAKNDELERFTYTVSHDLKSPLVTIKGFLGLLKKDTVEGKPERVEQDIRQIHDAADKMQRLIDELLELSRIGREVNPSKEIALTELAKEVVQLLSGRITERGVSVTVAPEMPTIFGDRVQLWQVFQNLIDNAVKFMGEQPEPRIEIGGRQEDQQVVCYVRDNGAGIAPRFHDTVFGLFKRLDTKSDGTGIGLATVKRIVEVHDGRIWVESAGAGQGSTFYFSLPSSPTKKQAVA